MGLAGKNTRFTIIIKSGATGIYVSNYHAWCRHKLINNETEYALICLTFKVASSHMYCSIICNWKYWKKNQTSVDSEIKSTGPIVKLDNYKG